MLKTRIIPVLLIKQGGLYKSRKFKNPIYIGDPMNAVKIFNEKQVDELILLDTEASFRKEGVNWDLIRGIASECFMPLTYGGGVNSIEQIQALQRMGVEKVSLNSAAFRNPNFVSEACARFGSSSIVASMDVKRALFGSKPKVWIDGGRKNTRADPVLYAAQLTKLGVGEILLNSIDRDGEMMGYDIDLIRAVASGVDVPVIACGGCGALDHMSEVVREAGVGAVAAGSFFVFHGKHRAVLISYPSGMDGVVGGA